MVSQCVDIFDVLLIVCVCTGGVRVDAMIWGSILPQAVRGLKYKGLMHTSDWFPTILELAGIDEYEPAEGFELDGISQAAAILEGRTSNFPRTKMLYNVYVNMDSMSFDLNSYTQAAVRNEQYKLIYAFVDNSVTKWYDYKGDDTDIVGDCDPQTAMTGTEFRKMLFDIVNDPYEEHDLYGTPELKSVQVLVKIGISAYRIQYMSFRVTRIVYCTLHIIAYCILYIAYHCVMQEYLKLFLWCHFVGMW